MYKRIRCGFQEGLTTELSFVCECLVLNLADVPCRWQHEHCYALVLTCVSCLFSGAEADVCVGVGTGCVGQSIRFDHWSEGGSHRLFLRAIPGEIESVPVQHLSRSFICPFLHSLDCSFTCSFVSACPCSFVRLFVPSFIYLFQNFHLGALTQLQ